MLHVYSHLVGLNESKKNRYTCYWEQTSENFVPAGSSKPGQLFCLSKTQWQSGSRLSVMIRLMFRKYSKEHPELTFTNWRSREDDRNEAPDH